ncbi:unnamed protein product [Cyberlindnera jadinii]|uniref:Uncharacterized protein n=1 Tax=Cyberlindnera jadinii (strain ATCC 18201 / CBS 1600 / BCRC 20928 / JCM 3617 / NBRC 0987 / NRRL Y-1542) TaxID=983966 RepID=A0A0H5C876_CYBJN|nr:unnamed protein product [Cyberlindnera jadinii]
MYQHTSALIHLQTPGKIFQEAISTSQIPSSTPRAHFCSIQYTIVHDGGYLEAFKFPNLKQLELKFVSFSPESLDFSKLEKLSLDACQSTDVESRWNLPCLKTLTVIQSFDTINESIDYQATTIGELSLNSIDDLETREGISNDSILRMVKSPRPGGIWKTFH